MSLSRSNAARVADLCNDAGRPRVTAQIIMQASDLIDAKRRIAASDPKVISRADMLKRLGVTEEQAATMRAERAKPRAVLTPAPRRTALERHDASRTLMVRQAAMMAMGGGFPGVVR